MPTTIKDLVAAVQATNNVIKDPHAGEKDLEAAAEQSTRPSPPTSKSPTRARRWKRRPMPKRASRHLTGRRHYP